jgi:hypothetical protein
VGNKIGIGTEVAWMRKRVAVRLLPNWASADNPGGPATFVRTGTQDAGALQVSLLAEYTGGKPPQPTPDDLVKLARGHGERQDAGKLVETKSGPCQLGYFGTAVFHSAEFPRIQLWYLSNGYDFVLATHVCTVEPEDAEVTEAQQTVGMLGLSG